MAEYIIETTEDTNFKYLRQDMIQNDVYWKGELVRCKNCKHSLTDGNGHWKCVCYGEIPNGNWFCANGETQEGDKR